MFCLTIEDKAVEKNFLNILQKYYNYFGCFEHVSPLPSKKIIRTCWNFDVSYFLRYYKDIANLLLWDSNLRMLDHVH